MADKKVCLIGQVIVDVTLAKVGENKLRLGGVFHPARALWALGVDFSLAYFAPSYLAGHIKDFAKVHGNPELINLGEVRGAPGVILIAEATEAGAQGYDLLLRESSETVEDLGGLDYLTTADFSEVMVFPGGFDLESVLTALSDSSARVYVDPAYDLKSFRDLETLGRKFDAIFMSTSSDLFLKEFNQDVNAIALAALDYAERFIFKENRGGVRLFPQGGDVVSVGAQLRPIVHSVGVGDCFDVAYVVSTRDSPDRAALAFASFVAAEYASTTYPDDFHSQIAGLKSIGGEKLVEIAGVILAWEARPPINVYIAAPDFDYVDRTPIEIVVNALRYHNFSPRRPILENGQVAVTDSAARRFEIHQADLELLSNCQIVVAVVIDDDPGTLVEIGLAVGRGLPVIVFDPYSRIQNLMLQQLPTKVSSSLDEVISAVFSSASKIVK
jgi:nucleoside 2-deoxyribosyltransferase